MFKSYCDDCGKELQEYKFFVIKDAHMFHFEMSRCESNARVGDNKIYCWRCVKNLFLKLFDPHYVNL